jgi:hypothetical protein
MRDPLPPAMQALSKRRLDIRELHCYGDPQDQNLIEAGKSMAENTSHTNGGNGPCSQQFISSRRAKGAWGRVSSRPARRISDEPWPARALIDGDPVNRSMGQYKAFSAEKLDLLNQDGVVERTRRCAD